MTTLHDKAALFNSLHRTGNALVLANAWDVVSARLIEEAGAAAIATTSAGVAWALGAPDGDKLDRDRAIDLIARVASAVEVPVTADIESGFADKPEGVGETVRGVLEAGAVGVNIEDSTDDASAPLRPVEEQAARLAAAREAADAMNVPLFINARVDVFIRAVGDPADRLRTALDRAAAYLAAGASGVFVPAVTDPQTVSALVQGVDGPLNILAGPGAPSIGELSALGVARVSIGSSIAVASYAFARRAAQEVLGAGTYESLASDIGYRDINALLSDRN
ncbi:isocitrate lyase/phosphoenolpyruvate mutase family protein [Planobispora siamensis]|uniref:2-methylisocitrate lyase n=1 Tax=Planobispora siamensis TaxID=936338 RepID=A0A8J3SAI5_9ACTN|nr:isocitrate lyase/phosphoenolpyruvate mutase family protein [Planobispora siamensis]GIH89804.1 2-methylisocitrate lyase [Planobispora siamensis]